MSRKRVCLCCGREYKYCPTCGRDLDRPKWMINFDTETCRDLFNAVSAVGMGEDKSIVESVIRKYRIKDYSIYKDSVRNVLEQIAEIEEKRLKKARGKVSSDSEDSNKKDVELELETADEVSE